MKTSELTGAALDWAVTKCETGQPLDRNGPFLVAFKYSTDWAQGGPIIEREQLSVEPLYTADGLDCWVAFGHNLRYDDHGNYIQGSDNRQYGPTPLIAAMRCYVASKLGDDIDVPEELK
jgi:hypothetical protein